MDRGLDSSSPGEVGRPGEACALPAFSRSLLPWQRFVLSEGLGARVRDLAQVLGQPAQAIQELRSTGASIRPVGTSAPGRGRSAGRFAELFALWHGRAPQDHEWPLPALRAKAHDYEWLPPELTLLASLVGVLGPTEIAQMLTQRLRQVTGDATAKRSRVSVLNQIARLGLQTSDVLGGVTASAAGREVGSYHMVHHAIRTGQIPSRTVGRFLVIPHEAWATWKSQAQGVPAGHVQLSTLREPLGIASDKLSEFARMGFVPLAVRVKPFGQKGVHTTKFGSWYVPEAVAEQLLADRRAGRPMPWHGKPLMDNLKVTYQRWRGRQHPATCRTCAEIWGAGGPPEDFTAYVQRYPAIGHGAKRHLTMPWTPGLTVPEVAQQAGKSARLVRLAIANGMLAAELHGRKAYVTRTDATRWIARRCPSGAGEKSWLALETAMKQYGFSREELQGFIGQGLLRTKLGENGPMRGVLYVCRHQCGQLRERQGFTEQQAAARVGVSVGRLRELLGGVNWRGAQGMPLATVQAILKRLRSRQGYSVEEAAQALGTTPGWVQARVDDGTVALRRATWDQRLYLSEPTMKRLRHAHLAPPRPQRLGEQWLRLSAAAALAGVCTTTLKRWSDAGEVAARPQPDGMRYLDLEVRARARSYWARCRYLRASPPAWLVAEGDVGPEVADSAGRGERAGGFAGKSGGRGSA